MEQQPISEQPISDMYQASEVALAALMVVYDSKSDLSEEVITDQAAQATGYMPAQVAEVVQALYDGSQPYLMQSDEAEGTSFGTNGLWLIETAMMQDSADLDPIEVAKQVLVRAKVISPVNAWEKHAAGGPYPHHLV